MGETRSDIQGRAEVVMKRIINELQLSSAIGVQIDTGGNNMDMGDSVTRTVHEYVCFETPVKNGRVMYDSKKNGRNPLWQGYVIYYVEPQNVNNASMTKKIYRKYVPHNLPSEPDPGWDGKTTAVPMPFVTLSGKLNTSVTGDEILRPICENLSYADFTIDGCIVNIELGFEKILRENSRSSLSPPEERVLKSLLLNVQ